MKIKEDNRYLVIVRLSKFDIAAYKRFLFDSDTLFIKALIFHSFCPVAESVKNKGFLY